MMDNLSAQQGIKSITLGAKIIRADGSEEDLGRVAEYHMQPSKMSKMLGGITILNPNLFQRYLRSK